MQRKTKCNTSVVPPKLQAKMSLKTEIGLNKIEHLRNNQNNEKAMAN